MGRYLSPESTQITDGIQAGAVPQDVYSEAFSTIALEHRLIHEGKAFFTNYDEALGLGGSFDVVAVTADNALIVSLADLIIVTGETQMDVYIGTTFTDIGTALTMANRNGRSTNTPTLLTYHTPTVDAIGTKIYTTTWGSGSKQGAVRDGFPAILDQDQVYMFRFTSSVAGNTVTHEFHWTEDTNRNP